MAFRYLPMTEQDKADMLAKIGVETVDELFQIYRKTYGIRVAYV